MTDTPVESPGLLIDLIVCALGGLSEQVPWVITSGGSLGESVVINQPADQTAE